jgi:D-3-phosphoglycerate dehydrogenase / 2-oxoglutarate reductase
VPLGWTSSSSRPSRPCSAVPDFVTVHLPRTPETANLLDADRLALMRPTARLINVARGGIIDEAALATALKEGRIAGAALDVFAAEPLVDSPLFGLPNAVLTPAPRASTSEAQDKAGTQVAEFVNLALAGEFLPSALNLQGGPLDDTLRPFLPLAERLGRLLASIADDGITGEITVEFLGAIAGSDCRVLGLGVLRGVLSAASTEPVTLVNAPLMAEHRGIHLREVNDPQSGDYVSVLRVRCMRRDGRVVAGRRDRAAAGGPRADHRGLGHADRRRADAAHGVLPLRRPSGRHRARSARHAARPT